MDEMNERRRQEFLKKMGLRLGLGIAVISILFLVFIGWLVVTFSVSPPWPMPEEGADALSWMLYMTGSMGYAFSRLFPIMLLVVVICFFSVALWLKYLKREYKKRKSEERKYE